MGAAASSPTRDAQRKYAVPVSSPTAAAAAAAAIAPTPVSAPALGPGSAPARAAMAPSPKSMPAPPPVHPTTLRAETSLLPKERRVKPALRDPRVVPARFVDFAELKDHGRLPRFGSNPKYKHPVTKEGNANMCHFREDFKMRTIFVFVTHFWGTEQDDDDVIAQQEVMPYVESTRRCRSSLPWLLGDDYLSCTPHSEQATMSQAQWDAVQPWGPAKVANPAGFPTPGVGAPERSARCGGRQENEGQWAS